MSFATIKTLSFLGMKPVEITVEVHIGSGLPFFTIVGLPDKSIGEAKERIRAVFNCLGLNLPPKRITINMSPASLQKEGSHYDLPIALGILVGMNIINQETVKNWLVLGELSLDGSLNKVPGILVAAVEAAAFGYVLVCPMKSSYEANIAGNNNILAFNNLLEILSYEKGGAINYIDDNLEIEDEFYNVDMKDVKGQMVAKRALEIAAVFRMHILLIGPPGVGKSMLAKRLPTILPSLNAKESLEISMIYSVSNNLNNHLKRKIPYRDPHHSASLAALIGGGTKAMPGEVSLAHNGILFLDELAEYSRVLEGLRQVMENKEVTIARANNHITYPANCQIIAAMNPCKCGYLGTLKECKKVPICGQEYTNKISGPLLDRFDLVVYMDNDDLLDDKIPESSQEIKARIVKAKEFYDENYKINFDFLKIEDMNVSKEAMDLLLKYSQQKQLSRRSFSKIIKIAKVISLLEKSFSVEKKHLAEAVAYRYR